MINRRKSLRKLFDAILTWSMLTISPIGLADEAGPAAQNIIGSFRSFQNEYTLGSENTAPLDVTLFQSSKRLEDLLGQSAAYLKSRMNDPTERKSQDYQSVLAIAKRLLKFSRLESLIRDGGCLASDNEDIKSLRRELLYGALIAPTTIEDCFSAGSNTKDIAAVVKAAQACSGGVCPSKEENTDGLFSYSQENKVAIIKGILDQKEKNDKYAKAFVSYGLTGRCSGDAFYCNEILKSFPPKERLNSKQEILSAINVRVASQNKLMLKATMDENTDEDRWLKKIERGRSKFLTSPIRFVGFEAIDTCVPKYTNFYKKDSRYLLAKSKLSSSVAEDQLPLLTEKDMDCLKNATESLLEKAGPQRLKEYKAQLEKAEHSDSKKHKKSERVDEVLEDLIIHEPISFGAYLMDKGSAKDLANICKTMVKIVNNKRDYRLRKSAYFASINVAGLMVVGAGLFISGPLGLAVGAAGVTVSLIDGMSYWKLEKKYAHAGEQADANSLQFRLNQSDPSVSYEAFSQEMEKHLHYLSEKEDARFWKYFAFTSVGLSTAGMSVAKLAEVAEEAGRATKAKTLMVDMIAKGDDKSHKLAADLTTVVQAGDEAVNHLLKMQKDPVEAAKFLKYVEKVKAQVPLTKLHHTLSEAELAASPVESGLAMYWGSDYTRNALLAMESLVKETQSAQRSTEVSHAEVERIIEISSRK